MALFMLRSIRHPGIPMSDVDVSRVPYEKRTSISLWQFVMFAAVGAIGTAAHYAVLFFLVEYGGQAPVIGTILGSIVGALINFLLNHKFTFQSHRKLSETVSQFMFVAGVSLVLNACLMYLFSRATALDYRIAQLIVTAVTLCFNYVANALWTFGKKLKKVDE